MPVFEPESHWAVLGGVFDPVHHGHIQLALDTIKNMNLKGVMFVPAFDPPHRPVSYRIDYDHRLKMVQLATKDHEEFFVSDIEKGISGKGYTIKTMKALKNSYPQIHFSFIIGADNLKTFTTWYRWPEILKEVDLLVGCRPGNEMVIPDDIPTEKIKLMETKLLDISSTDIRNKINSGISKEELSEFIPEAVVEYVLKNDLYQ